jgi:hypothetical protein
MAMRDRVFRYTDRPMTWSRAIVLGLIIWAIAIVFLGQVPSVIIYQADQEVAAIIEVSKNIPGVNKAGLNTTQIAIVRDLVANAVQMGFLTAMLVFAYYWQKAKQKRTGAKGLQDPVKGYMSGK